MEQRLKIALAMLIVSLVLQVNMVQAQPTETEDATFIGLELEKLVMFFTGLIALVLFIITFAAYRRDGRQRLFYVSLSFLLFAVKSFMLSSELFIEEIGWIEPVAIVLELLALISFFYGVLKK